MLVVAIPFVLPKQRLVLATTTSTQDSGLLDFILPDFERKHNCIVDVIAVGSGQAMELGKNGDADVLMVHSPASEKQFVQDGYGTSRTLVCYNQFVIVGAPSDPAGLSETHNATDAFTRICENGTLGNVVFVSRGDGSGTHTKEKALWAKAGLDVSTFSSDWYISAGQGMGAVLDITEQQMDADQQSNGYTIADEATYYTRKETGIIPNLDIVFSGDPLLFNQYSVIPVDPERWPHVNHTLASDFVEWITSEDIQEMIGNYTDAYGHKLFVPNAGPGVSLSMERQAAYVKNDVVARLEG